MKSILPDHLENQDVTGVAFSGQSLGPLQARRADLSFWRLQDSSLADCELVDCRWNGIRGSHSDWTNVTLDHCLMQAGDWRDCTLRHLRLQTTFATEGRFTRCRLEQCTGELSSLGLSVFENCTLCENRFSEVALIGSSWYDCQWHGEHYKFVRFPSSLFINTQFVNCTFQKAIFRCATFINCRFESCTLHESVFHRAKFTNTEFVDTPLDQAANLNGVEGLDLT